MLKDGDSTERLFDYAMNDIFHDTLPHLTVGEAGKQYEILRGQNLYLSLSLFLSLPLSLSASLLLCSYPL